MTETTVRMGLSAIELCTAIMLTDMAQDDPATLPACYRESAVANDWRRVTKVCEEAGEAWEALEGATGGARSSKNLGLGADGYGKVADELADTAMAALCGIQHLLKDEGLTWAHLVKAAVKARERSMGSPAVQAWLAQDHEAAGQ